MDIKKKKTIAIVFFIMLIITIILSALYLIDAYTPKVGPVGNGVDTKKVIVNVSFAITLSVMNFLVTYYDYRKNKNKQLQENDK